MNFALLGNHSTAAPLIQALFDLGHHIVWKTIEETTTSSDERLAKIPRCSWENLLLDPSVDAVLVAGESDETQLAAKQLASAGKPLLIVPHVALGAACVYELSLIRDDSRVQLVPALPHRFDPQLVELAERLAASASGSVRRLNVERQIAESTAAIGLTDNIIETAMIDDVDLLHWLGGRYDQVTAMRSGKSERGYSVATLTLAGTGLPDATWTCRLGTTSSCRLSIETEHETISWDQPTMRSPPTALIAAFVESVQQGSESRPGHSSTVPTWSDAVRVFDVLDAARRSLRRRRTIDVHFETLSERQQFKTQMTAMGCGLLMLTLVLMLALLGLGALLDSRDRAVRDAETAGLLLRDSDFESRTSDFSTQGIAAVDRIAERLKEEPKSAYLEPATDPPDANLDDRRRQTTVAQLTARGVEAANHRTQVAPARSGGWNTLMRILRLAWLAPLIVFLVMQGLILLARPTSPDRKNAGDLL